MTLAFDRFDPTACNFPRPRVPVLPTLSRDQLGAASPAPTTPRRHYARGRYALRAAYALAGVGPRGALLAPAYHCRTMLDPALRLGAEVALYPLTPDLHVDLDGLQRVAATCRTPPVALLLTHYFGLPREVAAVAQWCDLQGVALIEDCSHALPGTGGNPAAGRTPLGHNGRWAVSSPYKFFPCPDGGWLWANDGAPLPPEPPRKTSLRAELRGGLELWRRRHRTRDEPAAAEVDREIADLVQRRAPPGRDWTETTNQPSAEYVVSEEDATGLALSRWIERHIDLPQLMHRRRRRYLEWVQAVEDLPGVAALLPELPDGVVPYMFPLRVQDPPRLFDTLKHLGLPIWRWDDMAISDCAVSRRYRRGVFHLPCHQGLSDAQMSWMIATLRAVARMA